MQQPFGSAHRLRSIFTAASASFAAASVQAMPISGQGTWETTLQARYAAGSTDPVAYYDSTLNITWLADAHSSGTAQWQGDGTGVGVQYGVRPTSSFIGDLVIGGVTDWRLP